MLPYAFNLPGTSHQQPAAPPGPAATQHLYWSTQHLQAMLRERQRIWQACVSASQLPAFVESWISYVSSLAWNAEPDYQHLQGLIDSLLEQGSSGVISSGGNKRRRSIMQGGSSGAVAVCEGQQGCSKRLAAAVNEE